MSWQKGLAPSFDNIRSSDLVTSFALIEDRVDMANRISQYGHMFVYLNGISLYITCQAPDAAYGS
jgi:hypothetical protein